MTPSQLTALATRPRYLRRTRQLFGLSLWTRTVRVTVAHAAATAASHAASTAVAGVARAARVTRTLYVLGVRVVRTIGHVIWSENVEEPQR